MSATKTKTQICGTCSYYRQEPADYIDIETGDPICAYCISQRFECEEIHCTNECREADDVREILDALWCEMKYAYREAGQRGNWDRELDGLWPIVADWLGMARETIA